MSAAVQSPFKVLCMLTLMQSIFTEQASSADILEWLPITHTITSRSLQWPPRSHMNRRLPATLVLSPTTCSLDSFALSHWSFCFSWNRLLSPLFLTGCLLLVWKALAPGSHDLLFQDIQVSAHTSSFQRGLPLLLGPPSAPVTRYTPLFSLSYIFHYLKSYVFLYC